MISEMTDIHQHLLWGMDDGAKTEEITRAMLREAVQQGITKVAATCHAIPGMLPFDAGLYRERLSEAQDYCRQQHLPVQILPGAETAWTYQTVAALRQGKIPALGDTDHVLLELWPDISLHEARNAVRSLISAGFCPILAHVERYRCFSWFPRQALKFRQETGVLFQVNAGSFLHPQHAVMKRFVNRLLAEHGVDTVASDAHGIEGRTINLSLARDWLQNHTDIDYARELLSFASWFSV